MNDAIRKNRTAYAQLTLSNPDGTPAANRQVTVAQTRHQFLFGVAGFDILAAQLPASQAERAITARRLEKLTALFNAVTLPFYWSRFESARGKPMTRALRQAAQWSVKHQLVPKGHPLCWHTLAPDWLLPLSNTEILQAQRARITREVTNFGGLIDTWDVINEAVIMPVFDKYDNGLTRLCKEMGRIETIRTMFDTARAANPHAVLLLNDFDISPAFDILVEGCLEAGIQIDVIGIQSHMHQGYWGVEKTLRVLEQFERFRLPIHFTETTLISGHLMPPEIVDLNDYQIKRWRTTRQGEERQAREVIQHYTTLVAHPLVQGITWWDLADGGWLGAPAGLLRQDGSPKPAYAELTKLVKGEWWVAPTTLRTDTQGSIAFTGFPGEYELRCAGKKYAFTLDAPGAQAISLEL